MKINVYTSIDKGEYMNIIFTFGLNQPRTGSGLGLRDIGNQIPLSEKVRYQEYKDDIAEVVLSLPRTKTILIGHSFGGSASVNATKKLIESNITVDRLILLDPVPIDVAGFFNNKDFIIPGNVLQADCFVRPWYLRMFPPWSDPIRNEGHYFRNHNRSWSHNQFCSKDEVREFILQAVRDFQ